MALAAFRSKAPPPGACSVALSEVRKNPGPGSYHVERWGGRAHAIGPRAKKRLGPGGGGRQRYTESGPPAPATWVRQKAPPTIAGGAWQGLSAWHRQEMEGRDRFGFNVGPGQYDPLVDLLHPRAAAFEFGKSRGRVDKGDHAKDSAPTDTAVDPSLVFEPVNPAVKYPMPTFRRRQAARGGTTPLTASLRAKLHLDGVGSGGVMHLGTGRELPAPSSLRPLAYDTRGKLSQPLPPSFRRG
ncbi:hypothetical protein T492DRAFT_1068800 [Pavlovales sp. CCMP2436]|nr:hypothetical protein T492DRAFT_1068800 [Pavlovales sp. CCMP2436]